MITRQGGNFIVPDTYTDAAPLRELLRILVRKTGILERGEATCCSITLSQCHALVEIGRQANLSVNQLAELLGLDKSTVSRAVDKLVGDGTVLREEHPEDRRYATLRLTEDGRQLFDTIESRMTAYFHEVIQSIPEEKRPQVLESLQYLTAALQGPRCC